MLRRGSSSDKKADKANPDKPAKAEKPKTDKAKAKEAKAAEKKAAKAKAAEEKAKAAAEKAAKKKAGKAPRVKDPAAKEIRGVLDRRPKTSIYSVLLGISAAALAIGCLVLVLEIWTYGAPWTFPWKVPPNFK